MTTRATFVHTSVRIFRDLTFSKADFACLDHSDDFTDDLVVMRACVDPLRSVLDEELVDDQPRLEQPVFRLEVAKVPRRVEKPYLKREHSVQEMGGGRGSDIISWLLDVCMGCDVFPFIRDVSWGGIGIVTLTSSAENSSFKNPSSSFRSSGLASTFMITVRISSTVTAF